MTRSPSTQDEEDYEAIAAAVMETARGRWFLGEYARRNRSADTALILSAVERLDERLRRERTGDVAEDVRERLMELALAIETTRAGFVEHAEEARANGRAEAGDDPFASVVSGARAATAQVLSAAERVQEAAWTLREQGADTEICDALDQRATEIYLACTYQDAARRHVGAALSTLAAVDAELGTLMDDLGMARPAGRPVAAAAPPPIPEPALPSPAASVEASMADHDLFEADLEEEIAEAPSATSAPAPVRAPSSPPPPVKAPAPIAEAPRPVVVGATALKVATDHRPSPTPAPSAVPDFVARVDFADLSFAEKAALFA
jgi:hypothetical protein